MKAMEEFLVIVWLPFLYGAATRLPFIYYVIHLTVQFRLGMLTTGLYVAFYQACRVLTSALATQLPKTSHFLGTSLGVAGYALVYASDNARLFPFVLGTVIVGFSETMSSSQKFAKRLFAKEEDRSLADRKLRHQYASVMLGVVFAFSVGGFVYQYRGIDGVALFGLVVESLALVSLLDYVAMDYTAPHEDEDEDQDRARVFLANRTSNDSSANPSSVLTPAKSVLASALRDATSAFGSKEDISVTWLNWIMAFSFGVESLTIGYNLSIGPLFLLEEFGRETGIIGVMFAVGAASGTLCAIAVTCTVRGRKMLQRVARSPFDICASMVGIGIGVLVAAVPSFPVHVLGVILLMCFNDLAATLMTEFQGSTNTESNYAFIGPLGQVVRRSINCVTAITGPLLFGVLPRLPYIVAGGLTLLWTCFLFLAFRRRSESSLGVIADKTGYTPQEVKARVESGAIQYSSAEVLAATIGSARESFMRRLSRLKRERLAGLARPSRPSAASRSSSMTTAASGRAYSSRNVSAIDEIKEDDAAVSE